MFIITKNIHIYKKCTFLLEKTNSICKLLYILFSNELTDKFGDFDKNISLLRLPDYTGHIKKQYFSEISFNQKKII